MRGEKTWVACCTYTRAGSPPHARGKVFDLIVSDLRKRITPACAGKSLSITLTGRQPPDHPRMRGEKQSQRFLM